MSGTRSSSTAVTAAGSSHAITESIFGVEMLAFDEIDDLSPEVRSRYLRRLFEAELDAGVPEAKSHYRAYRRHKNSCTQVLDEVTVRG